MILARREIGDHVMARLTAKFEAIGAAAVGQRVVTAVALEPVVAGPTADPVIALAAKQTVLVAAAGQHVGPLIAVNQIIGGRARHRVVATATFNPTR